MGDKMNLIFGTNFADTGNLNKQYIESMRVNTSFE